MNEPVGWNVYSGPGLDGSYHFSHFVPAGGAAETCSGCGSPEVVYRNFNDLPLCRACADPPSPPVPWRRRIRTAVSALRGKTG